MPTPVTDPDLLAQLNAPARAEVQPSRRVWGDQEAQASGLYETPVPAGLKPVSDPGLLQQLNGKPGIPQITVRPAAAVAERFDEPEQPQNAQEMQRGLDQRGLEMMRGPQVPPVSQMAIEHGNLLSAASQGTSPHVDQYGGRLVSTDVHEDDGGNLLYRDTQTGELKPTNNATQVALRDPSDNRIKIFERSDQTNEGPLVGGARVLAPGLMAGAPTARPGIAAPSMKSATPRASETLSTAKPFYRAFDEEAKGIEVPGATAKGVVERITSKMDKMVPEYLADEVYKSVRRFGAGAPKEKSGLARLEAEMNNLPTETAGVATTLDELRNIKELVGKSFQSPDPRVRQAAAIATGEINKVISEVAPSAFKNLKTADAIYSTARAQRELQQKSDIAGLRTGAAGYGGNAVNNMRQVLKPIVQKSIEGKVTGFQPGEIAAMREIVEGTTATNNLRQVGALSPAKGGLQLLATAGTAGATGAVGMAANKLATVLTAQQIERLNELVAKRSPAYAQAVAKAVERFEKAQVEFANNPAPNTFAGYLTASRALASGLTKDGIQITSGDLLRSIQGPMKAAAEGDEPPVPRGPGQ